MLTRRQFLLTSSTAMAQSPSRKPNIVFILADDVGYECFSPYGSKQYSTPVLSRLADAGVKFNHCYSTPLCTPTRVSLMTGQSNVRNYTDFGALRPGEYTFAKLFKDAGYATAIAGKWQLDGSNRVKGTAPAESGFDQWCLWNTGLTGRNRYWNPSIDLNGKLKSATKDDYGPDHYSAFLLDFIERNQHRPFFAYYPMALTHGPFEPTPDSADRNSKNNQKNFEDMVAYADKIVGRFVKKLEDLNLTRNTILIFTADNGTAHDLQSTLNGHTIHGDKGSATDGGTHVPLIVYAPGLIKGGRVLNDLVDPTDFLPTFADAIGAQLPANHAFDGRSFLPQLKGEKGNPRPYIYSYYFPRPYAEKYDTPYAHPEIRFARDQRFKLYSDGRLFDLQSDPHETRATTNPAAQKKLQAALEAMPAHGQAIPREYSEKSKNVPIPKW
ncbi:MAG: sulfatase-like hydrolase/transferase [Acidobacteria bacterium]|nr:sulfatase-like hydrolase/transferase [Acidobacteriota bacterium]